MGGPGTAILLVGSPKGGGSTSEALGRYLLEELEGRKIEPGVAHVLRSLRSEEAKRDLLHSLGGAGLLILATPLYADSLPSGVTRLLEILAAKHNGKDWLGGKRFVALINCGFPEARHCDTAAAICRCFAREAGMEWAGGLSLGGGEAIGGKSLSEAGGVARNARKALDMAAEALAVGLPVPEEAVSLMAAPVVSTWLYTLIGDIGWRLKARRHGTGSRLKDRPYRR